jgi:sterol desaturase/sphingolipid hydroxylase (fatty acid hydroxylase superfamily)
MSFETIVVYKAWIIAGWFLLVFAGERLAAAVPAPRGIMRLFTNVALWLLLLILSPLIVLPLTAFAAEHPLWVRPDGAEWPRLIADLVILDLWAYWLHRAYHEIPIMWRMHAVHHLDEHLDSTSAFRFHFTEVALSALFRMIPVMLLAIPFNHVVVFETLLLAASIFHHSNLRLPPAVERALARVVVTPSIHWVHHHAARGDTNSNYAAILSLWDPVFRTRNPQPRMQGMKIGLEGHRERPLLKLLVTPFTERVQ